jgi:drug/metabolite transporter (DMT)-like permease
VFGLYLLVYIFAILVWGTTWYAIKLQVAYLEPSVSVAYRFFAAALILISIAAFRGRLVELARKNFKLLAWEALLIFSANYILFYYATSYISSGIVAVIFSTLPLMIQLNLVLFQGERLSRKVLLGNVMGFTGICLLFASELLHMSNLRQAAIGVGLALLATYVAAWGNIQAKKVYAKGVPILENNAIAMLMGSLMTFAFVFSQGHELAIPSEPVFWYALAYLTVFGTVLGFAAYFTLLRKMGPERAAYITVLFPIVALIVSSYMEGFHWSIYAFVGLALTILGNVLVFRKES